MRGASMARCSRTSLSGRLHYLERHDFAGTPNRWFWQDHYLERRQFLGSYFISSKPFVEQTVVIGLLNDPCVRTFPTFPSDELLVLQAWLSVCGACVDSGAACSTPRHGGTACGTISHIIAVFAHIKIYPEYFTAFGILRDSVFS